MVRLGQDSLTDSFTHREHTGNGEAEMGVNISLS